MPAVLSDGPKNHLRGRNLRRDPRVPVMVDPPESPYACAEIRGDAIVTADTGHRLLGEPPRKYTGLRYAAFHPASRDAGERVTVRVTPVRVTGRR
ncbi:hypothetical protein [Streptomyces sp. NPDC026673]|uniref:hypothetical protein n=1 Tax=Streptomyces sp. NPDC026673 TaxID=3155724 RepID=UPI0033DBD820